MTWGQIRFYIEIIQIMSEQKIIAYHQIVRLILRISRIFIYPEPVSYTHLDVYKRQIASCFKSVAKIRLFPITANFMHTIFSFISQLST